MSGQQQQIEFSEEELQKFQRFFNLEEELYAKDEIENAFDLYDKTFKTPSEAKAYNNWRRAKKAKEWKDTDAGIRAPSTDQPTVPDPHPLDVYRDQLAKINFAGIDGVAVLNELLNGGLHPHFSIEYTKSTAFRLVSNTCILGPTTKINWHHSADLTVLPSIILGINHDVRIIKIKDYGEEERAAILRCVNDPDPHSSDEEKDDSGLSHLQLYAKLARKVESFSTPDRRYGKYGRPEPNVQPDPSSSGSTSGMPSGIGYWEGGLAPRDDTPPDAQRCQRRFHDSI